MNDGFMCRLWVRSGPAARCRWLTRTGQEMFSAGVEQNGLIIRWIFPYESLVLASGLVPVERPAPDEASHARIWHDEGWVDCDATTVVRLWNGGPISCIGVHGHSPFVTRHLIGAHAFRLMEMRRDELAPFAIPDVVSNEDWPELWDNRKVLK